MSIVVLALYAIQLGEKTEKDEDYIVEMILDEELLEEILKKEIAKEQSQAIETHTAFNETAKPSYGNPEPLKTLDEILEEKAASETGKPSEDLIADSEYAARVKELTKKREEKKQLLGEKEAQKKEFTNYLAEKKTTISYSLLERNNYRLPPPIYTCIEGGKVVVNIEVDANGYVTDASFNEKSSGTSNGCLVDNAIAYALKAKFSSASKVLQKGTITYLFQSK
ncbi:energy transducer TonB family protein [Maribacter antarcticus]|uniref:energy transducer TonB family protein n=1 Tax=Maribacter antarcticus TaxID=505250 RepID=UPI000B2EE3C6|nr:energy transducer TonB [Maribacter antarcticus]